MSTVSEELYVEMQRNHIAYENELKERIADLEDSEQELIGERDCLVAIKSDLERERDELAAFLFEAHGRWHLRDSELQALARRDKLVVAEALEQAAEILLVFEREAREVGDHRSANAYSCSKSTITGEANRLRREADELNGEQK